MLQRYVSLLFETTVQLDNSAQPRVKLNYESRLGWRVTFITLLPECTYCASAAGTASWSDTSRRVSITISTTAVTRGLPTPGAVSDESSLPPSRLGQGLMSM